MVGLELKTHYSVYEYAEFGVSGLPKAPKNIQAFFERNKCKARKRQGRGGGVEYELASLPMDLQIHGGGCCNKTKTTPNG